MSMRLIFRRFSFARMQSLFGSGDAAVAAGIMPTGKALESVYEPEKTKAVVARAVAEGAPFRGLKQEEIEHVEAANLLMGYGQETPFVEMEDWKWYAYSDFDEAAEAAGMPRASHKLVHHLAEGRPLFGKQSCVTGQFYAYLTQDEARTLHAAIEALVAKTPEMRDPDYMDGFVVELQAALVEVIESRQDLWASAS